MTCTRHRAPKCARCQRAAVVKASRERLRERDPVAFRMDRFGVPRRLRGQLEQLAREAGILR